MPDQIDQPPGIVQNSRRFRTSFLPFRRFRHSHCTLDPIRDPTRHGEDHPVSHKSPVCPRPGRPWRPWDLHRYGAGRESRLFVE
jgi:hypothetical protein